MADSALTPDPLERYGAIERAYCEERWTAVIHDGQTLLSDLAHADPAPPEGLRERLQLLMGHAFLYGLGDRDSAEDHYQAVLRSGAEADLRQIAAQGLEQCALPTSAAQSSLLEEEPLEPQNASTVSPGGPGEAGRQEAAAWGAAALVEPGSQAQSAPQSGPDVQPQDGWAVAAAEASAEPVPSGAGDALSWLTPEAPAAAQDGDATPVMPWLEGDAAPGPAREPSSQSWSPSAEVPAQPSAPVPQPATAADPFSAQAAEAWAGDRGLSPESVASLQATAAAVAAAFGQQLGGTPPTVVFMAQPPAASGVAAPPEAAAAERLLADVVEEPEQLELRQAAGLEQEELLLQVETQAPPQPSVLEVTATVMPAEAASGPPRSTDDMDQTAPAPVPVVEPVPPLLLERRGVEPMDEAPEADLRDAIRPQEQPPLAAQGDDQTASPLDLRKDSPQGDSAAVETAEPPADFSGSLPRTRAGKGPFSAPPQPVAEEDPELLMGLLRVEMG